MYLVIYNAAQTWEDTMDEKISDNLLKCYPVFATVNEFKDIFPIVKYLANDIVKTNIINIVFNEEDVKMDRNVSYDVIGKNLFVNFNENKLDGELLFQLTFDVVLLDKQGAFLQSDECNFEKITDEDLYHFEEIAM